MSLSFEFSRKRYFAYLLESFWESTQMNFCVGFLQLDQHIVFACDIPEDSLKAHLFKRGLYATHEILHLLLSFLCCVSIVYVLMNLCA